MIKTMILLTISVRERVNANEGKHSQENEHQIRKMPCWRPISSTYVNVLIG